MIASILQSYHLRYLCARQPDSIASSFGFAHQALNIQANAYIFCSNRTPSFSLHIVLAKCVNASVFAVHRTRHIGRFVRWLAAVQSIQLWRGACSHHPQGCFPTIHLGSCHLYVAFSTIHIRGHVHKWNIDCGNSAPITPRMSSNSRQNMKMLIILLLPTSFRSPQIATRALSCFICSLLAPKSPEKKPITKDLAASHSKSAYRMAASRAPFGMWLPSLPMPSGSLYIWITFISAAGWHKLTLFGWVLRVNGAFLNAGDMHSWTIASLQLTFIISDLCGTRDGACRRCSAAKESGFSLSALPNSYHVYNRLCWCDYLANW